MASTRLSEKQSQGRDWEQTALRYLRRHGLVLIEANFTCKGGEIDLIMRDGDSFVFVEVRQRADRRRVAQPFEQDCGTDVQPSGQLPRGVTGAAGRPRRDRFPERAHVRHGPSLRPFRPPR